MIICFAGHRPNKLGGYKPNETQDIVKQWLSETIASYDAEFFISGAAQGVDMWAAGECINLGKKFKLYLPFDEMGNNWTKAAQAQLEYLKSQALEVDSTGFIVPNEYGDVKWGELYFHRDERMVDDSDLVIAVWNGDVEGGTYHTVNYAESKGKPVIYFPYSYLIEDKARGLNYLKKEVTPDD